MGRTMGQSPFAVADEPYYWARKARQSRIDASSWKGRIRAAMAATSACSTGPSEVLRLDVWSTPIDLS